MSVDFKAKQLEFTRYIRDPVSYPSPADVKPERMYMYRQLVFNNIDGFLANNFPVLRKILSDQQWFDLVQDFFAKHVCKTPYFSEIAEEFLHYLEHGRDAPDDYPFLLELAHYEWVEMALSLAKDEVEIAGPTSSDLMDITIKMSALAWLLAYQFPVQLISPDFLPAEPSAQPVFLLAYRDGDDNVNFIEINAMTYRMLEIIGESKAIKGKDCLAQIAHEAQHPNPDIVTAGGLQILKGLVEKKVVLVCEPV